MHVVCKAQLNTQRPLTADKKVRIVRITRGGIEKSWKRARRALFDCTFSFIFLAANPEIPIAVAAAVPLQSQPNEVVLSAGFLGIGDEDIDKNSSDPFTLQGTTQKKYSVEELDGEKIVKRRQGVTARTCVKIALTAQSGGSGNLEAPEMSCTAACQDSLEDFRVSAGGEFGLPPSKESLERPQKRCTRNCSYECQKEGSGYRFTVNSTS